MMLSQSLASAINGAVISGTATGPAAVFTTPAFIATAVSGVLAAFASIPSFATGGIIAGTSTTGDNILARVNSGEMILNNSQQRRLFETLNGNNSGISGDVEFKISGNNLVGVLNNHSKRLKNTR
nr:hypothetical protein [uncultured Draconibacterium sp.]